MLKIRNPIHKKVISKLLKTTVLFHFYQFVIKYLNAGFIVKSLTYLEQNLTSPRQAGSRTRDFCTNQLLPAIHEILSAFDIGLEARGLFLDLSKAFDKFWHAELICKV